jgi:hypothetical protein
VQYYRAEFDRLRPRAEDYKNSTPHILLVRRMAACSQGEMPRPATYGDR